MICEPAKEAGQVATSAMKDPSFYHRRLFTRLARSQTTARGENWSNIVPPGVRCRRGHRGIVSRLDKGNEEFFFWWTH